MEHTKTTEGQHARYNFSSEVNKIIDMFQVKQHIVEADGTKTITLQDDDRKKETISLHIYLSGIEDKTMFDKLAIKFDLIPKDSSWIAIDHIINDKVLGTYNSFRLGFDEEKWRSGNFTAIRYGDHEVFDGNKLKGERIRNINLNQTEIAIKLKGLIALLDEPNAN